MNTSLFSAGNLAFKRDLVNQGEQASRRRSSFPHRRLASSARTARPSPASNYSAVQLEANARGIPLVLLKNSAYGAKADRHARPHPRESSRPLRDRSPVQCRRRQRSEAGCVYAPPSTDVRGGEHAVERRRPPPPTRWSIRLTVRVDGPRDTQVFLQSSFTKPE